MAKEKNKTELPEVMEGELRARLIKLREDAGYDLAQMASVLCLSQEVIVNLENEAFDLLPEPPYVRGYLRNYAKLGEDDTSELINRYEALRGADADELNFRAETPNNLTTKTLKKISPVWLQVIMLAVLLGVIALLLSIPSVKNWVTQTWEGFSSQLEPSNAENNPSLTGELPVPTILPEDKNNSLEIPDQSLATNNETSSIAETPTEEPTKASTETVPETPAITTQEAAAKIAAEISKANTDKPLVNKLEGNLQDNKKVSERKQPATTTTELNTATVETEPDGVINIRLVFNKDVWLRIRDKDNKSLVEGINKEGTEKSIDLAKPLTFRAGNAQGLTLYVDNEKVDISSYINGSTANFTLE